MEVTINTLSEIQQEADIQVSHEELQPHFERAYKKIQPKIAVKGFRKGKVPLGMIKKMYGEAIEHESLDDIANELYREAMQERNIHPVGRPSMVDLDFKRGNHFRFRIKYEIKPSIALGKYKGIVVEKPVHKITDEEVDTEIERLRRANSTTSDVSSVTDNDHIVTGDVQELDEAGNPLIGRKTTNAKFYLSDENLADEVRNMLSNAEIGGVYRGSFETRHEDHRHRKHVSITVSKIEKVHLPPFDDELVKKLTQEKVTSVDDLRKNLVADLERYWEEQSERRLSDAIAAELVKTHNFPVPDSLVEGFLDAFVDDIRSRSRDRALPKNFDEEKFRAESREYAVWQTKWLLLKERIAEAESISVTDDDLQDLAESESVSLGIDKDRLLQYYKSSPSVPDRILSGKVMTLIKGTAIITEKPMDEQTTA